MSPGEIIEGANDAGVRLALSQSGSISAKGNQSAIDQWLPEIAQSKAAIIAELHHERRRAKVLAMLHDHPDVRYAINVVDATSDPVVVSVALRNIAAFEMNIPQSCYDGFVLLGLIEKYTGEHDANS